MASVRSATADAIKREHRAGPRHHRTPPPPGPRVSPALCGPARGPSELRPRQRRAARWQCASAQPHEPMWLPQLWPPCPHGMPADWGPRQTQESPRLQRGPPQPPCPSRPMLRPWRSGPADVERRMRSDLHKWPRCGRRAGSGLDKAQVRPNPLVGKLHTSSFWPFRPRHPQHPPDRVTLKLRQVWRHRHEAADAVHHTHRPGGTQSRGLSRRLRAWQDRLRGPSTWRVARASCAHPPPGPERSPDTSCRSPMRKAPRSSEMSHCAHAVSERAASPRSRPAMVTSHLSGLSGTPAKRQAARKTGAGGASKRMPRSSTEKSSAHWRSMSAGMPGLPDRTRDIEERGRKARPCSAIHRRRRPFKTIAPDLASCPRRAAHLLEGTAGSPGVIPACSFGPRPGPSSTNSESEPAPWRPQGRKADRIAPFVSYHIDMVSRRRWRHPRVSHTRAAAAGASQ